MEDKAINSTQSIELIQKMIAASREKFERGAGLSFLIWGYASALVTIAVLVIYNLTLNPYTFFGWWAIPAVGYTLSLIFKPNSKNKPVRTHVDVFLSNLWAALGFALILIPADGMFAFSNGALIMPIEGIILSAGVVVMGLTVKVPSVTVGGIIAGALSFAKFFLLDYSPYIFLLMFIFAMIIPGHILNHKAKTQCSKN